jgi:nicotinamidase-related amidase
MKNKIGLWEVDCRELSKDGRTWELRQRVKPLAVKLDQLGDFARKHELTTVFTACCSARMPQRGGRGGFLFVPLRGNENRWESRLGEHSLIYLEKTTCGDPQLNYQYRAFDVFHGNHNAKRLLLLLDIPTWIVYGNGFELCVASAVEGILKAGRSVRLVTDVLAQSAGGYADYGTEGSRARAIVQLGEKGAETLSLQELMLELG